MVASTSSLVSKEDEIIWNEGGGSFSSTPFFKSDTIAPASKGTYATRYLGPYPQTPAPRALPAPSRNFSSHSPSLKSSDSNQSILGEISIAVHKESPHRQK